PVLDHPVPRRTASWWYTFGSATLALFVLQIATGICLAFLYVPSADEAYKSLLHLNYEAPFGWYLRAVHFWGSNAMVAVMTLHMIQVFLWGAHRYPRGLTWIVGGFLFLCPLGLAFTGELRLWHSVAGWGLGSASTSGRCRAGSSIVRRTGCATWRRSIGTVCPSSRMSCARTWCRWPWPSCSSSPAPRSSVRSVPTACLIRRSSTRRRSQTSTSWPSSRCSPCCRRGPKPRYCSSARLWRSRSFWRCRSWRGPE